MGGEGSTGVIPDESFRKVLDDQRMIFVSPNDTGKGTDAFVCDALAHEAVNVIRKRYRIDRENVYVGGICLLYTSPSPRDKRQSRMPSSA